MPKTEAFATVEDYYHVLFHESVHATGHQKRLNRDTLTGLTSFGSATYSEEELVAEMGAWFLSNHAGIITSEHLLQNSAAYIESWLRVLKKDSKAVVYAAQRAQKAADHILGKAKEEETAVEAE